MEEEEYKLYLVHSMVTDEHLYEDEPMYIQMQFGIYDSTQRFIPARTKEEAIAIFKENYKKEVKDVMRIVEDTIKANEFKIDGFKITLEKILKKANQ
jgi:hypothetical protein